MIDRADAPGVAALGRASRAWYTTTVAMPKKVLVTGGTGFVGGRLALALAAAGERVVVLARPGANVCALREAGVQVAEGDIRVEHTVFRAMAGCDRVYHCAAVYTLWARHPAAVMSGAIDGTMNVLRSAHARGLERVVYTSTAYTVGSSATPEELDETTEWTEPSGPVYAIAKRRAEEQALEYAARTELPLIVVNPGGVFGPGDSRPTPSGQGILDVLTSPALPFLGTLVPRAPGGMNIVDIDDVVDGHRRAMEHGKLGERYLLTGDNVPISTFFETLTSLVGRPAPRLRATRAMALATGALLSAIARITDVPPKLSLETARGTFGRFFYFSHAKATRDLGYEARPARRTLARSVRYYIDRGYVSPRLVRAMRLDATAMAAA